VVSGLAIIFLVIGVNFETAISTNIQWALDGQIGVKGARMMNFEAIKAAVMNLDAGEQRRVVLELLPEIWPQIVGDASCLKLIRQLVDEESVRRYQQEHLDHI
jgi:hypothetical protein